MTDLKLLFPQWQAGAAGNKVHHGARIIADDLVWQDMIEVPLVVDQPGQKSHDIMAYDVVKQQLCDSLGIINHHHPDRILTIGGDCSIDVASISYLAHKYGDDYLLVWFDAHGDLHTPQSSPSKNFHGMPIRTLLGEGDPGIVQSLPSHLNLGQVILVGIRDLEPAETEFIKTTSLMAFSASEAEQNPQKIIDMIKAKGKKYLHVHIDLDSLDPDVFPYVSYPIPNGLQLHTIQTIVESLQPSLEMVGFALTEYSCDHQAGLPIIRKLLNLSFIQPNLMEDTIIKPEIVPQTKNDQIATRK